MFGTLTHTVHFSRLLPNMAHGHSWLLIPCCHKSGGLRGQALRYRATEKFSMVGRSLATVGIE